MIETQGLGHVHVLVGDLERALAFYVSVFGAEESFRLEEKKMVFLRLPGSGDVVVVHESPGYRSERGGIDHFGLALKNPAGLDFAVSEVEAAGGRLIERGEHAPGIPYAYISDPDGNVIEL